MQSNGLVIRCMIQYNCIWRLFDIKDKIFGMLKEATVMYDKAIGELFAEKEKEIIIGLTGRTGSGCSTTAKILQRKQEQLDFELDETEIEKETDKYKFEIIKKYICAEGRWKPFTCIEGSCVILSYVFENEMNSDGLINYLVKLQSSQNDISFHITNFDELIEDIKGFEHIFLKIKEKPLLDDILWNSCTEEEIREYYDLYINKLPDYKNRVKKMLLRYSCYEERRKKIQDEPPIKYHLYTYLLQKIGNNIRATGKPFEEVFVQSQIFSFAKRIEKLICLIKQYDSIENTKTRICIDAIRNANESNYIKDKFRSYFLMSISVDELTRRRRLESLDGEEQHSLDNVEYNNKLDEGEFFYHQNIANCFEMADIHLVNKQVKNEKNFFLTWQLMKYITLMIHPGLITPSAMERCMQLAYNAKYNSGCLSRQVGAVVTGPDFAIKSVGWNEVPEGQLSCSLRDVDGYCKGNMKECYSDFEYENSMFGEALNKINRAANAVDLHGRKLPFCFKDVYNGYKKEKNQVYTRALHAEENAFLQISKYGGQGVKNGFLFCTASPCELCSKKAYQLGIRNIYYIDPYPGISEKHILSFGNGKNDPTMNLFYGAIGEAYIRLYKPLLAYKDELELVSGINCKKEAQRANDDIVQGPETNDLLYHDIEFTLEFKTREKIESVRHVDIKIINGEYKQLDRKLTWTGSSYDNSELVNNKENYVLVDSVDKVSPYKYKIQFNKELKKNDNIEYTIKSFVNDETHMMHPYLAQMVKHPTEHLKLKIIVPKDYTLIKNVHYVRYADMKMECEYEDTDKLHKITDKVYGDTVVYALEIQNPNLFYTYSIEWEFC